MPLSPERWQVIRAVFAELSELPVPERDARLADLVFDDADLGAEIGALLIAADNVGDRFERVPTDGLIAEPGAEVGDRVGPYRIIREIGRGGMGTVFEAHREDAGFDKRVALKMVARGRDTAAIVRRFRYERQILARLEHRNIAALLDGGVSEAGQPYFAMEYVEGARIDRYCQEHRLGIRDRLQLFRQACAAVHYAHQHLVVHRDLKPSNILVGSDGTVKLLDFGIAKVLDPSDDSQDPMTQAGATPMTTAYASPEQLAGDRVTTASDVYSLGVVLYELLAGRPPFETGELSASEVRRRRIESAPTPPSRAVLTGSLVSDPEPTPEGRRRALAGELDNLVLMALRKEPDRRYRSVEALGEDILRFLAGLPIQATPDSIRYRVSKFVHRNRLATAAAVVAVASVLAGTGVTLWQLGVARSERDRAERERVKATEVTEFFRSVFLAASPVKLGPAVTVVEAVDEASRRLDSTFAKPDRLWLKTALQSTLSTTYFDMGLPAKALPLARAAMVSQAILDSGRITVDGANQIYNMAGVALEVGNLAEADSLFRRAMAMYEQIPGTDPIEIAAGWGQVGLILSRQGRAKEALELQGRTVDFLRSRVPETSRTLMIATVNYGSELTEAGRLADGQKTLRDGLALAEGQRGLDHDDVALALQPLAMSLMYSGQLDDALVMARRGLAIMTKRRGPLNTATLAAGRAVMSVLVEQKACVQALAMADEVIQARGPDLPDSELSLGSAFLVRGQCLGLLGRFSEAESALRDGLALRLETLPPAHWAVSHAKSLLGEVVVRRDRKEGIRLLEEGAQGIETALSPVNRRAVQARQRLEPYR